MTNWQEVKLGEICTIIDGDRGKNYPKSNELQPQGYCLFLNTKNVPDNKFNFSECTFISKDKDELLGKGKLNYGDIVVTTRGTLANFAYYTKKCIYNKIRINSGMVILRNENKDLCTHYLYHFLISNNFKQQVQSLATGSAQPQLPIKDMKNIIMNLPPIDIQKKIAGVLGALDDKIELNNRINNNLEQQAQSLFKSWFVDFEPFGGTMPKDWKEINLSDIATFVGGYSYKGSELQTSSTAMATIKNFDRSGGFKLDGFKEIIPSSKLKSTQYVELFDTLVAHTDLTQNAEVIGNAEILYSKNSYQNIIISMDVVKVLPKQGISKFLLAAVLKDNRFKQHCMGYINGTTVLHLSKKALPEYCFAFPEDANTTNALSALLHELYEKIALNIEENTRLSALRDTLLPKLMSGEIDVSKVDINELNVTDDLL